MLSKVLFAVLFVTISSFALAQGETLTNKTVITLYSAGLDSTIIVSKIQSSSCQFDLSSSGLIALKKAKVPLGVIQAMMDKEAGKSAVRNTSPQETGPTLDLVNHIYFYDKTTGSAKPLEKNTASFKTKKKILGYGGIDLLYEIPGEASSFRLAGGDVPCFVMNVGGGTADAFVLYKVDVKKNVRQAVSSSIATFGGGAKGSMGVVGTNIKELRTGVYEITPVAKLEKGEYLFAPKNGADLSTASSATVYSFGVD